MTARHGASTTRLERSITLPMLVLYGLGTAIGAGIYVLVGEAAGRAGLLAPISFIVAGAFASAAVADGSVGYLREFVDLSPSVLVVLVVLAIGLIAAWGIGESVAVAATLTVIEAAGLLAIVGFGLTGPDSVAPRAGDLVPESFDLDLWSGVFSASLLAVFAFIGFEDMVNVAEETEQPRRTLPRAIFITLIATMVLYVLVASVAVLSVEPEVLAEDEAPLALVYRETAGFSSELISTIAVLATLNTILVQIIMVSRVVYGMADRGTMPATFARVHPRTRTPLLATAITVGAVIVLALAFPPGPPGRFHLAGRPDHLGPGQPGAHPHEAPGRRAAPRNVYRAFVGPGGGSRHGGRPAGRHVMAVTDRSGPTHPVPVPHRPSHQEDPMSNPVTACPECGTKNRVPADASGKPRCASCHTDLPWLADVGAEEFDRVIADSALPALVDLWAPWCGPCRMVAPALEQLARDRAGSLRVVKVNVDEAPSVSQGLGVQGIPTMVLFRDGREIARQVGAMPGDAIARWVDGELAAT